MTGSRKSKGQTKKASGGTARKPASHSVKARGVVKGPGSSTSKRHGTKRPPQGASAIVRSRKTIQETSSDLEKMRQALRLRIERALQQTLGDASAQDLAEALATATDIGSLALLLSRKIVDDPDIQRLDPWAEFLMKGTVRKKELIRAAGGAYKTGEVADLLGISRQAVLMRIKRGKILALTLGSDDYLFPACQFDDKGVIAGLDEVLAAFNIEDSWTRLSVLLDTDDAIGGQRIIDALREGEIRTVLRIVRNFAA